MESENMSWNQTILYFKGKTIAILGYRDDGGRQQAQALRESGIDVVIGLREEDEVWVIALNDGFPVYNVWDAVAQADIAQVWQ